MLTFTGTAWGGSAVAWENGRVVRHEITAFEFAQGRRLDLLVAHAGYPVGFVKLYRILGSNGEELHVLGVVNEQQVEARVRGAELLGLSVAIAEPRGLNQLNGDTRQLSRVTPLEVSLVATPASATAWISDLDGVRAPVSVVRIADERKRDAAERDRHARLVRREREQQEGERRLRRLLGYTR